MNAFGIRLAAGLFAASLMVGPTALAGQASPLVIEMHGGTAVPVSSFATGTAAGEGTDAMESFGLAFAVSGAGRRTVYVGFSEHRFGCEAAGCAPGDRYVATGFDLGLRINLRTTGSVVPWLRLGALTTRVDVPAIPNDRAGVSALGFGGEAGIGLYIGASSPVALVPGIRLAAVNTELPGGSLLRMRYVVVDVALSLAF